MSKPIPHAYPTALLSDVGMSLRDYFAGQAISGLVVGCAGVIQGEFSAYATGHCNAVLANRAYALADFMLREREKEPS